MLCNYVIECELYNVSDVILLYLYDVNLYDVMIDGDGHANY